MIWIPDTEEGIEVEIDDSTGSMKVIKGNKTIKQVLSKHFDDRTKRSDESKITTEQFNAYKALYKF